jgi:hypothetical protein
MILDIMRSGMLSVEFYPDQAPLLHALIAAASTFTGVGAMQLQKFLVPVLSVISILTLYKISNEFFDEEIAITSALLLSVGTAYIHWTSQAVCESLGISLGILALYVSYRSLRDVKYLPAALLLIVGLVLTHHLSTLIFIVWWNSFALARIYLESQEVRESALGWIISTFSLLSALIWWKFRLPNIYNTVDGSLNGLFRTDNAIYIAFLSLVLLYAIPILAPGIVNWIRLILDRLFQFRTSIYKGMVLISIAGASLALHFVMGMSFFVLSYSLLFYSNGILMILLAIAGLTSFLYRDKIPILAWAGGVGLMFIGSVLEIYYAEDPLRFIEFIYPPLAIIGAAGLIDLTKKFGRRSRAASLSSICLFSLIVAFPSTVFWGDVYPPSDLRYDARAWVISHPHSQIMAINFIEEHGAGGNLFTDRYVGYASEHLENFTVRYDKRVGPERLSSSHDLALITKRMKEYAEFGIWPYWDKGRAVEDRMPLSYSELEIIQGNASIIYDNEESWIYRR